MDNKVDKTTVRAVERSLDILSCFIEDNELSLTDISKRLSLNKSTVYRLLNTLEKKGFLIRSLENDKYHLGYRLWELSKNLNGKDDPAALFLPLMKKLRDDIDETVTLYVRDGIERIRIQSVESNQPIRRVAPIGVRLPLSVGASSKVLIAFEEEREVEQILNQLEIQHGINKSAFYDIIKEIYQNGYATSFEERESGAAALAFPVLTTTKHLIAALAISGPINRLTPERIKEIIPRVNEAANQMGRLLK